MSVCDERATHSDGSTRSSVVVDSYPTVSVVVPVLDEVTDIGDVVRGFLAGTDPSVLEVLVVDGGSQDGTREVVEALAQENPRVKLLENPHRIQAAGLNVALAHAAGEVFLRADGHSEYAPDYVARCLEALEDPAARNVGGRQRFLATNAFQVGTALAASSYLGSGGALYRRPGYEGWADTVFLGCFRSAELRTLGGFVPEAHPAEDAELNLRLSAMAEKESGCTGIWVGPEIRVWYHPRPTWWLFVVQSFHHGRGRARTVRLHPRRTSLRGRLPVLVALSVVLGPILEVGARGSIGWTGTALVGGGLLTLVYGLWVAWTARGDCERDIWRGPSGQLPSLVSQSFFCALAVGTRPLAHGIGFAWQWTRDGFLGAERRQGGQASLAIPEPGELQD
ncbi:MAG TPA: glycosyltransferase family 2 protein [Deltaproteobacteria bacterium]|nr:glycosyl transferase [Deltaproteobacteria bacterium]HCP46158.1 glycosyltransferase family 2 protein [Deltaproteobacteria bacterium]